MTDALLPVSSPDGAGTPRDGLTRSPRPSSRLQMAPGRLPAQRDPGLRMPPPMPKMTTPSCAVGSQD